MKINSAAQRLSQLHQLVKKFPNSPGCYLFIGDKGQVLYVGKARDLRARVSSYFSSSGTSAKTHAMLQKVHSLEFIITSNEAEAYICENSLIKRHRPRYNIRLRDDKTYPYVTIDFNEPFPRLNFARRPKARPGQKIFGPFPVGSQVLAIMRILTKAFQLRDCSLREFKSRKNPCLLYQIQHCSAPCVGHIQEASYRQDLDKVVDFFSGKGAETLKLLNQKMLVASEATHFELALNLRDWLRDLEGFLENSLQQNAELQVGPKNFDIFGPYLGASEWDLGLYMIRNSQLMGQKNFTFPLDSDWSDDFDELICKAAFQYYSQVPWDEIEAVYLPVKFAPTVQLTSALQSFRPGDHPLSVHPVPKELDKMGQLVTDYARGHAQTRHQRGRSFFHGHLQLQKLLNLTERPHTIEGMDTAVWQGQSPTGGVVHFREGRAQKDLYRYFHLGPFESGNNDFAAMEEMMDRRLKRGQLPDVFLIDGGLGQVNAVKASMEKLGIEVPVIGLAKERDRGKEKERPERLILPKRKNPVELKKYPELSALLLPIRNEAHRFCRKLHHKSEKKRVINPWPMEVPGLGSVTSQKILQKVSGGPHQLVGLNRDQLQEYLGVSKGIAQKIYNYIREQYS